MVCAVRYASPVGVLMSGRGGTGRARARESVDARDGWLGSGLAPSNLRALGFARRVAPRPRPRRAGDARLDGRAARRVLGHVRAGRPGPEREATRLLNVSFDSETK